LPGIEDVVGFAMDKLMTLCDIAFDMGAHSSSCVTRPIEKIGVIVVFRHWLIGILLLSVSAVAGWLIFWNLSRQV